jgi:SAM-dependent methyltransferase
MVGGVVESQIIFDRLLWRRRRHRAAALPPAAFLLERIAAELTDRLSTVLRRFELALDLGTPDDAVRAALRRSRSLGTIVGVDVFARDKPFVVADEEALPFGDGTIDLVVSALALQFVNDLPGVFLQIRRALKPDGLFIAALFGGDTLTELRQSFAAAESEVEGGASPHVAPFVELRELGGLLQRGFRVAGHRCRARHRALRFGLRPDAGSTAHGGHQLTDLAPADATAPHHAHAHGGNLCAAFRRRRWAHPGHIRHRLAVGLGAASGSATAAQARLGQGTACRRAWRARDLGRREGRSLTRAR